MTRIAARRLHSLLGSWRSSDAAYRALADTVRMLMADGRIVPETTLPAERDLAAELGVSRATVASAYAALRTSGHVESVRGSGTRTVGVRDRRLARADLPPGAINLQQASPAAWPGLAGIISDVAERAPAVIAAPGYEMVGLPSLREAIADRYNGQGLSTDPDEILITNGAQSAIAMLARVLRVRGRSVLIETPTYPHAIEAFLTAGARLAGIPVSLADGWDIALGEQTLLTRNVPAAYLMPHFQNPTGAVMPADVAGRLIRASRGNTVLIADETTAELFAGEYGGHVPFARFAQRDSEIVTLGSLGKTVWGGLRVGWVRASRALITKLIAARAVSDLGTPNLEQEIAAMAVRRLDEIVAYRAEIAGRSQAALAAALRGRMPEWIVPEPRGGVSLWVGLPREASTALVVTARREQLYLSPGSRFSIAGGMERFIRVPTTSGEADVQLIAERLGAAWRRVEVMAGAERDLVSALDRPI